MYVLVGCQMIWQCRANMLTTSNAYSSEPETQADCSDGSRWPTSATLVLSGARCQRHWTPIDSVESSSWTDRVARSCRSRSTLVHLRDPHPQLSRRCLRKVETLSNVVSLLNESGDWLRTSDRWLDQSCVKDACGKFKCRWCLEWKFWPI